MSLKSKKMQKKARNAALSALIVSAIVGSGVASAATTADNVSRINAGTTVTYANNESASALHVNGGTLYVGSNVIIGKSVDHEVNLGATANSNVLISAGRLVVGMKAPGTGVSQPVAGSVTMTVDNMTIVGGEAVVTNNSKLHSLGDIDINSGGTLKMSGTFNSDGTAKDDSGSTVIAKNVNINGGTLEVNQGLQNVIQHEDRTGAVNLRGGTIAVTKTYNAALTIAEKGYTPTYTPTKGMLYVAPKGILNSYGGTIKAHLKSDGKINFNGGTTTVDNLTVSHGITTIKGDATVNVLSDKPEIVDGTLRMEGGTLSVKGGEGTLLVKGGLLLSALNVNTVKGSVAVSAGQVAAEGGSTLNITKNLDVSSAGRVFIRDGSTLSVAGTTTLVTDAVTVGNGTGSFGFFSITKNSILKDGTTAGTFTANAGIANNAIDLQTTSGGAVDGVLIITGWNGTVDADNVKSALTGVDGKILGNTLTGNNVILMGAALKDVTAKIDTGTNAGLVAYGSAVTVANTNPGGTFTNTGTIIVPKLVQGTGVTEYINSTGKTTLVGTGAVDSTTTFTKYTQSGAGTTTVMGGAGLIAHEVAISAGSVSVETGSSLNTSSVNMSGGLLSVTNSTANIGTLKSTGGTIFIDPAYVNVGNIVDSLGAQLLTGSGSVLNVGGAAGWMNKPMADAGFSFKNPDQAILGLAPTGTIKIGATGIVVVDPTVKANTTGTGYELTYTDVTGGAPVDKTADATQADIGAFWAGNNSLTIIDASRLNGDPVFDLSGASTKHVNIANGAKLHVANLTVNGLQIFDNVGDIDTADGRIGGSYDSTAANAGWAGKNLIQPDRMLTASMNKNGHLDATVNSASATFGMSSEFEGLMQNVWGNALNNTNSANAGIRFVSRAASTDYGMSADQVAKTIEGAAQLGAVAGVQGVTMGAANAATAAVATRTSFAQPLLDKSKAVALNMDSEGRVSVDSGLSAGNGMKNGLALWIMPLYQSNNMWGQDAGNFQSGYNSDLGGVAAGVDYTVNDMFRFGAALNIGAGYSQSNGDFSSTDNSFNFWGVNLYGGWTMNNFGLTADVGYTGNYNSVEQDGAASLGMANYKSDINTSAWTAGLKAEYKIETSVMDIIPHVGVRYMGLTTEQYDVKGGGGTMFDVEENFQSIWTFPIGVALSKTFEIGSGPSSNWTFKPQLDLSVIPAAGDVEAKSTSRIPGAPGSADAKMQVVDYVTFDGGVGFDIGNDNLSFGLNYNIQASEHRTGHGVFGTVRYEF